jgi:dipeptidyl aminopeptidase/acylaminoacyl peptidase
VDLDVLARDALACVRRLKTQPEIDPRRVGLWGISQGGWITPLAAGLDDAPAFIINSLGPATSLRRHLQDKRRGEITGQVSTFDFIVKS